MTAAADTTAMVPVEPQAVERAPARPQFLQGFDGIATEPFPDDVRRALAAPIDPRDVEIKPDGIVFLPGVAYRRILTKAFGAGGWAIAPRSPSRVMGNIVVYHGALFCLGRFVAEAVGECFYRENNPNMSYASCVEGAKTDALSRCCKDLGIATDLWDANWREAWKAEFATSYRGKKWDGKKQQEVDTTLWKLKSRVSNPHDLMAGAGGVAPPAAASAKSESITPEPTPPVAPAAAPAAPDSGVVATAEQKDSIKGIIRQLGWKVGFVRIWFEQRFGAAFNGASNPLERLTSDQADTAYLLLLSQKTSDERFAAALAEFKALGKVVG